MFGGFRVWGGVEAAPFAVGRACGLPGAMVCAGGDGGGTFPTRRFRFVHIKRVQWE